MFKLQLLVKKFEKNELFGSLFYCYIWYYYLVYYLVYQTNSISNRFFISVLLSKLHVLTQLFNMINPDIDYCNS